MQLVLNLVKLPIAKQTAFTNRFYQQHINLPKSRNIYFSAPSPYWEILAQFFVALYEHKLRHVHSTAW